MSLQPVISHYAVPSAPGVAAGLRAATAAPRPAEQVEPEMSKAKAALELPPDALQAVQAAARAYEQLRATGRELRFQATDTGLRIEVFDGSGNLVRRIPPNEAMALAAPKGATWLA
jgi:propanediol dehydratase small subunit